MYMYRLYMYISIDTFTWKQNFYYTDLPTYLLGLNSACKVGTPNACIAGSNWTRWRTRLYSQMKDLHI